MAAVVRSFHEQENHSWVNQTSDLRGDLLKSINHLSPGLLFDLLLMIKGSEISKHYMACDVSVLRTKVSSELEAMEELTIPPQAVKEILAKAYKTWSVLH